MPPVREPAPGLTLERDDVSMPPIKKIVTWLLVIFLLYAIFTSPTEAADMVGSAWDVVTNGVGNIGEFFDSLIARS